MMRFKLPKFTIRQKKSKPKESCSVTPRIITFCSPKATGKTTLAAVLSAALAGEGQRVACVDFDLYTPDLPVRGYGLDQIVEEVLRGDFNPIATALKLPCLKPPRVHLLSGPTDTVRAENLGRSELLRLINALTEQFDAVVLDTNQTLALEATLVALDAADLIIMPVTPKDNIVRHVGRYLSLMEQGLCLDMQKTRLVLNQRVDKKAVLSTSDVEYVLGRRIAAEIPYCQGWENWNRENLPPVDGREDLLLKMINSNVFTEKEVLANGSSELGG